jgi:hypothetical protein
VRHSGTPQSKLISFHGSGLGLLAGCAEHIDSITTPAATPAIANLVLTFICGLLHFRRDCCSCRPHGAARAAIRSRGFDGRALVATARVKEIGFGFRA